MKPQKEVEKVLEMMRNRSEALRTNYCIPRPVGCGMPINGFRDPQSAREYTISGLCQACQDSIFGSEF